MSKYKSFLDNKRQLSGNFGFEPVYMNDKAFPFQQALSTFAVNKGRCALFADCGLGKTLMELIWAQNVVEKTNGRVLILTPLSVSRQTVEEGEKFGIECHRSHKGELDGKIIVTNYERLHFFKPEDFAGVVCDESGILKNFKGTTKADVTEFMRTREFRLLCTATAAPNDFVELGTSSEALGDLGYIAMLQRFFKASDGSFAQGGGAGRRTRFSESESFEGKFYIKPHAERDFWRWVCSWARAVRKPGDMGFSNDGYDLPELITNHHMVESPVQDSGFLFPMIAQGLKEQRHERSITVKDRCEKAAEITLSHNDSAVCWCHLNTEGDLLAKLIPDSIQVSGSDSDEKKEEAFEAFERGKVRVIVTKPTIAGFGLNWAHCHRQTTFPSHSFEQWYQSIRRSWRFGQKNNVTIDVISSEAEADVLKNLQRKARAADRMFENLISFMSDELKIQEKETHVNDMELPAWI